MSGSTFVGFRGVVGSHRRHVAAVRKEGSTAYAVRTLCGSISRAVISDVQPEVATPAANEVLRRYLDHPAACGRCAHSFSLRFPGGAA